MTGCADPGAITVSGCTFRKILPMQNGAPFTMHKIIDLALAAAAALAAIAPALADSQLSAECIAEMDRLTTVEVTTRKAADAYRLLVENLRDYGPEKFEAEQNKYFARFDAEKTLTLSGTVKEFQWGSPRARITLNVPNGEAQPATWAIEMNGPSGLARLGWRPKTLTPGMPITLTIHPLRDGSNGGQFLTATLPDGTQMDGGRPLTLQITLQTLRDQAAAADRAVAEFTKQRLEFLQRRGCGR